MAKKRPAAARVDGSSQAKPPKKAAGARKPAAKPGPKPTKKPKSKAKSARAWSEGPGFAMAIGIRAAIAQELRQSSPEDVAHGLVGLAMNAKDQGRDDFAAFLIAEAMGIDETLLERVFAFDSDSDDADGDPRSCAAAAAAADAEEDAEVATCRDALLRAERQLGKKAFKDFAGGFWGFHETRPYMRARLDLAFALLDAGDEAEAIEHFEAMLRLNPNDNQGVRYPLLAAYLAQADRDGWESLFERYPKEWSCLFEWGKVLASLLTGDEEAARVALVAARSMNPHAEAFFNGSRPFPDEGPGAYSPGEPSEAEYCAFELGEAWETHFEAMDWLAAQPGN